MKLKWIGLFSSLLLILVSVSSMIVAPEKDEVTIDSDRINLAIRQMADQLLKVNGDHETRIPPVKEIVPGTYQLEIQQGIFYDTLPNLLADALNTLEIDQDYYVAIRDCNRDSLILGYHSNAFKKGVISCKGREQDKACYQIEVTFEKSELTGVLRTYLPLTVGLIGIGFVFFYREKGNEATGEEDTDLIKIGNSIFYPKNQKIIINGNEKSLTFREAKFLELLVLNKNEVIDREKILGDVWGDEGVIVGRSVDVFISRLRKIIKTDDRLQIKTIHGVGYRLEES